MEATKKKVKISAMQTITYEKEFDLTEEEIEDLEKASDAKAAMLLEGVFEEGDVIDWSDLTDIFINEVKEPRP